MSCKKCKCKVCSCIKNDVPKIAVNGIVQNQNENDVVNIKVPTKTSQLINDSSFGQGNGGGTGGQKIENIRVNGELVPIINKEAIMNVPTKTSNLINDSNFVTKPYVDTHIVNKANPHNVTKEQIGLGNVDNTSDLNKPISTGTQTELNKKLDKPTTNNTPEYVLLADGSTIPRSDFGKVKSVNGKEGDVVLKNSDLENDSDYTTKSYVDEGVGRVIDINTSGILDSINPSTNTSSLEDGVYRAQIPGTYTNASNIVVKEGYYTLLRKTAGVWTLESEVKMPTLSPTGVVEEGNTQAVSGGEVFDSINPITTALFETTYKTIAKTLPQLGSTFNSVTGTTTNVVGYNRTTTGSRIVIDYGKKYVITTKINSKAYTAIVFYNSAGTAFPSSQFKGIGEWENEEIIIPDGMVSFGISCVDDYDFNLSEKILISKFDKSGKIEKNDTNFVFGETVNGAIYGERSSLYKLVNLWSNDFPLGLLSTSGNVNTHSESKVSPFIEIPYVDNLILNSNKKIGLVIVCFYNENKQNITGTSTGYITAYNGVVVDRPALARYIRVSADIHLQNSNFTFNIGNIVDTSGDYYVEDLKALMLKDSQVQTKHIQDDSITSEKLSEDLRNSIISNKKYYSTQLNFKEVSEGHNILIGISNDLKTTYYARGKALYQSRDKGVTFQMIGSGNVYQDADVNGMRQLENGELIITTYRNENYRSTALKTSGYNEENPSDISFYTVLVSESPNANLYGIWGIEVFGNQILLSEYGLKGVNGARYVYKSTDNGENFNIIFDLQVTPLTVPNAPTPTETAHLHTIHFDRFWNRIWLSVGDNPNSNVYYSDDYGTSWQLANNDINMQYTGITSYGEGVIFGSDRSPNGIYVWERTRSKTDEVVIKPKLLINNIPVITHVFERCWRPYKKSNEMMFFASIRVEDYAGIEGAVICASTGINDIVEVFRFDPIYVGVNHVLYTDDGTVITTYYNGSKHVVLNAEMPIIE